MMGVRALIWLGVVAIVIVGVSVLTRPEETGGNAGNMPAALADAPDLHLEQASITQYREDGSMKYQLKSARIRHFEDAQITRLITPALALHNAPNAPWQLNSERGYIRKRDDLAGNTEELMYLSDSVVVEQRHDDGRFIRLQSPSMYLYPDSLRAETSQNVIIDTEVGHTTAASLQGDLQNRHLRLFSDAEQRVHTTVLRSQFK